jgi:hypothetical protein
VGDPAHAQFLVQQPPVGRVAQVGLGMRCR